MAYGCVDKFISVMHERMNISEQALVRKVIAGKCVNKVIKLFTRGVYKSYIHSS